MFEDMCIKPGCVFSSAKTTKSIVMNITYIIHPEQRMLHRVYLISSWK